MNKIDITTTQNVTIEFDLANIRDRASAFLIDSLVVYIGSLALWGIILLIALDEKFISYLYVSIPTSFLYYLLMESLVNGQTLGKKVLKIRVVKISGERPDFFDFLIRVIFRFIDITISLGTLALIMISSTEKGQRIGDYFADTTVVKIAKVNPVSFDRIIAMDNLKSHNPTYPDVILFTEDEMLLLKEISNRYINYPNESHSLALDEIVAKIEKKLGVKSPADKVKFLATLIKDYVSLTR